MRKSNFQRLARLSALGGPAGKDPISTYLTRVLGKTVVDGHADRRFTARADLAASMLALLDDDRYLRTTVSVVTTVDNPTLLRWIRDAQTKS